MIQMNPMANAQPADQTIDRHREESLRMREDVEHLREASVETIARAGQIMRRLQKLRKRIKRDRQAGRRRSRR